MKQKLIFLTTAITRRELHNETIGKFYKEHYGLLEKKYELHHIINIDMPLPLRDGNFSYTRTKQLFNRIIPSNVKKYYIINKKDNEPSFTKAYTKVLMYLKDKKLMDANSLVWWLEDDWKLINNLNFVSLLDLLNINTNGALSLCNKAPMCSFRGGPVMNALFFQHFFNNYTTKKDPEEAVNKVIRMNQTIPIYENNIYISLLCIKKHMQSSVSFHHACPWWYKRKYINTIKMNPNKTIYYIIGIIDNNKIYYKRSTNSYDLVVHKNQKVGLNTYSFQEFKNYLELNSTISYISIYPHIFEDIGRTFNANNNLKSPKGQ